MNKQSQVFKDNLLGGSRPFADNNDTANLTLKDGNKKFVGLSQTIAGSNERKYFFGFLLRSKIQPYEVYSHNAKENHVFARKTGSELDISSDMKIENILEAQQLTNDGCQINLNKFGCNWLFKNINTPP